MKVAELRAELKRRGLDTDGLKAVLAKRLAEDDEARAAGAAEMVHGEYRSSVLAEGGGTPRSLRFLKVRGLGMLS